MLAAVASACTCVSSAVVEHCEPIVALFSHTCVNRHDHSQQTWYASTHMNSTQDSTALAHIACSVCGACGRRAAAAAVSCWPRSCGSRISHDLLFAVCRRYLYVIYVFCTVLEWLLSDVCEWLCDPSISFEGYVSKFKEFMIDGDMLLQLTDEELKDEIGMSANLHRKRFPIFPRHGNTSDIYVHTTSQQTVNSLIFLQISTCNVGNIQ